MKPERASFAIPLLLNGTIYAVSPDREASLRRRQHRPDRLYRVPVDRSFFGERLGELLLRIVGVAQLIDECVVECTCVSHVESPHSCRECSGAEGSRTGHIGMGLGFFISKTLLEHTGATVTFQNGKPRGAVVAARWAGAVTAVRINQLEADPAALLCGFVGQVERSGKACDRITDRHAAWSCPAQIRPLSVSHCVAMSAADSSVRW